MTGNYSSLPLQKKYFDIILINGMPKYKNPCQMLTNVLQLLTDEGIIIYYADETSPLESTLRHFFKTSEEYMISPARKILIAKAVDKCFENNDVILRAAHNHTSI